MRDRQRGKVMTAHDADLHERGAMPAAEFAQSPAPRHVELLQRGMAVDDDHTECKAAKEVEVLQGSRPSRAKKCNQRAIYEVGRAISANG